MIILDFFRLRYILKRIAKDDIAKEDLIKNLEYAASVLETVYIDETRYGAWGNISIIAEHL